MSGDISSQDQVHRPLAVDPDHPREACGVLAVYCPGGLAAPLIADGLHALQHRGQEAAGLAVSHGSRIVVIKGVGLVTDVLSRRVIGGLKGDRGIGHTRYSTTGSSTWANAQPCMRFTPLLEFALAHNGNLTNTAQLLAELTAERVAQFADRQPDSDIPATNDSDMIAELIAGTVMRDPEGTGGLEAALVKALPRLEGAFSLVLTDGERLVGLRDPNGFRPLCLGVLGSGWVLASETAALHAIGAEFVSELAPGEMIIIEPGLPPRSVRPFPADRIDPRLCVFEFVYMARPDSQLYGREVHGARVRMGELLARKAPVDADLVMGVPDSGLPAAEGFALASGIAYGSGLVKNRYIGRTFINPTREERERNARRKLQVLTERVRGKRLVVIEDSIIRGTTTIYLSKMLREAGATEIHFRVALPPVRWPCFYGIDIGTRKELLGALMSTEEIRDLLGADTLAYLTVDELREAIGVPGAGFCDACMTDNYPTLVPETSRADPLKFALE
ncbi:MAG TPA: amidophosphoribosyltransferase [Streptosporangiaceae bacterium]|nr:amidophosphoribosyltransferase [Streptosporangiaceae bacterium]